MVLSNKKLIEAYLPKWTQRVVTDMTGRDPLGLSRVSNFITDSLLSGITVQTHRARYYLSFCWALWHMQVIENIKKYSDYVDSFRSKEALIALSTLARNQEISPVGIEAAKPKLEKGLQDGIINLDFKILPSNSMGAYGQYYSGSIYNLGLTHRTEQGIDCITESGKELAEVFHNTVRHTPYIKNKIYQKDKITVDELNQTKRQFSLGAIRESIGSKEREKLIEIFFGFNGHNQSFEITLRKHSITLILYIISEYQKIGSPIHANNPLEVEWSMLYPVCYYGVLKIKDEKPLSFKSLKQLESCISLWKQFCLHEFFTQSLEKILYGVLEMLEIDNNRGMSIDEMVTSILQSGFHKRLKVLSGKESINPAKLLKNISIDNVPNEKLSLDMQNSIGMDDPRSEAGILTTTDSAPDMNFAEAIFVLSVLYGKWRGLSNDYGIRHMVSSAGSELWMRSMFSFCDRWLSDEYTWENLLREIIITYIKDRHDEVMWSKKRLDSCWLHYMDGRLYKDQDYQPIWRSSRFLSVVDILLDLLLVEMDDNRHILITSEGKKILKRSLSM